MDESSRVAIFLAQAGNVRTLERVWRHINADINRAILRGQESAVSFETRLLAFIYCAYAEAIFSKLIHTPHGLSLGGIAQIKLIAANAGVRAAWVKCAELAVREVEAKNNSYVPNVLKKLRSIISTYIHDPSIIRNKLAHGQWETALNSENDSLNELVTAEILTLNAVELYRRKHALTVLARLVEDLIKSPNKAHFRDYWIHLQDFEDGAEVMQSWTMERKREQLRNKHSRFRPV